MFIKIIDAIITSVFMLVIGILVYSVVVQSAYEYAYIQNQPISPVQFTHAKKLIKEHPQIAYLYQKAIRNNEMTLAQYRHLEKSIQDMTKNSTLKKNAKIKKTTGLFNSIDSFPIGILLILLLYAFLFLYAFLTRRNR